MPQPSRSTFSILNLSKFSVFNEFKAFFLNYVKTVPGFVHKPWFSLISSIKNAKQNFHKLFPQTHTNSNFFIKNIFRQKPTSKQIYLKPFIRFVPLKSFYSISLLKAFLPLNNWRELKSLRKQNTIYSLFFMSQVLSAFYGKL